MTDFGAYLDHFLPCMPTIGLWRNVTFDLGVVCLLCMGFTYVKHINMLIWKHHFYMSK